MGRSVYKRLPFCLRPSCVMMLVCSVNMSPNTVRKYVTELVERGLIQTEHTSIITQDGRKQNGSLLYTLLPIQISIQQFYEQKLAKLDAECEQKRIRKRLEAFQLAQQETARPPA